MKTMKRRNIVEVRNCCTKLNGIRANIEIHICLVLPSGLLIYILAYLLTYLLNYLLTYLITYLLTYLLTPCSTVLLEKLTGSQLVKEFPAFYGTRMFITAFTRADRLSLF